MGFVVAYYTIMAPGVVSYFLHGTAMFLSNDIYLNARRIRSDENDFLVVRRGGKITTRFFRGNRDGIWSRIRFISCATLRNVR